MRILYIHGFASSPHSRKAGYFRQQLAAEGLGLTVPDLAPDFEHMTISGQLAVMDRTISGQPAVLIGSSLGGYLSALYAAEHANVERLVLLAPAFRFAELWEARFSAPELAEWRANGTRPFYHYGLGREAALGYQLIEDARKYKPEPDVRQPTLILHGNQDDAVPVESSVRYAAARHNVRLKRFEAGHELNEVLPAVWKSAREFLLNPETHI